MTPDSVWRMMFCPRVLLVPVPTGTHACVQINYSNKNNLSAAMIVAGWDAEGGGQVCNP